MSNTSNYIQNVEDVQQISKKYWQYVYELRHIPTGLLYVGSRSRKDVLKKFEDCYTDDYLGSSCRDEGPFSSKDTKINPQNYQKTILKVFYDEDPKKAWKYENGDTGLIMTYWNIYGKDKVLNEKCYLNNGSKVFSTSGQNPYANKTPEQMEDIKKKISENNKGKNPFANKSEEEMRTIRQKMSKGHKNKTEEEKKEINQRKSNTWHNRTEIEKAEINQRKSEREKGKNKGKYSLSNKTEEEKKEIFRKRSEALKGEKNGAKTLFQHPYNPDFVGNGNKISHDIKKNYPNEKQWNDIIQIEKEKLKIKHDKCNCSIQ